MLWQCRCGVGWGVAACVVGMLLACCCVLLECSGDVVGVVGMLLGLLLGLSLECWWDVVWRLLWCCRVVVEVLLGCCGVGEWLGCCGSVLVCVAGCAWCCCCAGVLEVLWTFVQV